MPAPPNKRLASGFCGRGARSLGGEIWRLELHWFEPDGGFNRPVSDSHMNPISQWAEAHGGLVGLGVEFAKWSLVLFSILSLAIIVERVIALRRVRALENAQFPDTRDFLRTNQLFEGNAPCQRIAAAGWNHRATPMRMREAMERATTLEIAALSFNLPILATAASTAPYIGLFGTVLGILAAFRQIAQSGQTGAAVIAGGISEALTATALGLGVAIPAVLAYNYFTGRVNSIALEIETHAEELAAVLDFEPDQIAAPSTVQTPGSARAGVEPAGAERDSLMHKIAQHEVGASENANGDSPRSARQDRPTTAEVNADAPNAQGQ